MKPQYQKQIVNRLAILLLPMLLLAACDSNLVPEPEPSLQTASVSFDATAAWPGYGESLRAVGRQTFQYGISTASGGQFNVRLRPETIEAAFTGMTSGELYEQSWLGPSDEWEYVKGPAGTEQYLSETILVKNTRTDEVAEGLVVTKAIITGNGDVSFEVLEVIPLP